MSYLAVVVVLGVLIFVHELGHFWAAKAVGIGVPRFSIGLGPITPLRFRRGETEYVISWIPFGGYVKMASQEELGELEALEGGEVESPFPPERFFENKPLAARILVISAGVVMNALFAWLAYGFLAYAYGRAEDPTTRIAGVEAALLPQSAQALETVPFGAEVVRVGGREIPYWSAIADAVLGASGDEIRFEFADGVAPVTVDVPAGDVKSRALIVQALQPLWESRIGSLGQGRPAEKAGLRTGDLVTAIDGTELGSWFDLVRIVEASAGESLTFTVVRGEAELEIEVTPAEEEVPDPVTGEKRKVGRIGIGAPAYDPIRIRYGPVEAVAEGARQAARVGAFVLLTVKGLVTGQISIRELAGPVGIAQMSAQAAREGLEVLLAFMALLSMNLAILNLLPIPVLDGGHLVFLALEGLRRGRPVPKVWRQRFTMAGFYFLMALMLFVIVNDILR